jgi:hypothetical protein
VPGESARWAERLSVGVTRACNVARDTTYGRGCELGPTVDPPVLRV